MTLSFPNRSRSFEPRQDRVRFWGHDSAIEITFFLEGAALRNLCPVPSTDEADVLRAFDSAISCIHQIAEQAYERNRGRSNTLVLTESLL